MKSEGFSFGLQNKITLTITKNPDSPKKRPDNRPLLLFINKSKEECR